MEAVENAGQSSSYGCGHLTMKRLLVSLDVMSDSLSLDELALAFGSSTSVNSFSRGTTDDLGRIRRYSLLRFESSADEGATCEEHIAALKMDIDRIDTHLTVSGTVDASLLLNIGILSTRAEGPS